MYLVKKDRIFDENVMYIYWEDDDGKFFRARKKVAHGRYIGGFARRQQINVHSHTIIEVNKDGIKMEA